MQQPTFNASSFSGVSGQIFFPVTSPFLTPEARATLTGLGVSRIGISRALVDLVDPTGYSENRLYRGVIGARGEFAALGHSFNYEISGNYGRTDIRDFNQAINSSASSTRPTSPRMLPARSFVTRR